VRVRNFSGINPAAPSSIVSTRRVDYDMNPPHTDEFLVGAEHELWSDFAVGVTFTHRVNNDLPVVRYEKTQGAGDWYTSADYEPAFTAGGTYAGQFYTVTVPTVQVYQLKAGLANPNFSVITNRPNYKQTYNGFEVTATKRMSHQWMLRVNASYNDYKEDCGEGSFANPTPALPSTGLINGAAAQAGPANCLGGLIAPQSAGSGAFGNVFLNSKWNTNVSTVYVAPWDINIGANLLMRQGYPNVYRVTSTPVSPRGGTPGIVFQDLGDSRFDNVYQLDLRVAKDFRLMSLATFTISADVFNATNQRTILQRNGAIFNNSGTDVAAPQGYRITEIQAPRVFRIGGKVTF
jgi:hypothetical protein